ncbi:MAG TPA: hypothetical protein VGN12_06105 [Pirellulales bacterium]
MATGDVVGCPKVAQIKTQRKRIAVENSELERTQGHRQLPIKVW